MFVKLYSCILLEKNLVNLVLGEECFSKLIIHMKKGLLFIESIIYIYICIICHNKNGTFQNIWVKI